MNKRITLPLLVSFSALALAFQASVRQSSAQVYTMSSANSVATFDSTGGTGLNSWTVENQAQLVQQWFYYRVGSAANQGIQAIGPVGAVLSPDGTILNVTYGNAQSPYEVDIQYSLSGGAWGSGTSDISEQIKIYNYSLTSSLDFHLLQYCNFDLGGFANNDTATIYKIPVLGTDFDAYQSGGNNLPNITANASVDQGAVRGEADYAGNTLPRLLGGAYDLNNVLTAGPGDVTWALQWDLTIAPNSSDTFSEGDRIVGAVPEPSAMALASLGLVVLGLRMRRQQA